MWSGSPERLLAWGPTDPDMRDWRTWLLGATLRYATEGRADTTAQKHQSGA